MRRVLFVLSAFTLPLALLGGAVASPASSQGNSEAANLCKDGGWRDHIDAHGLAFKNQGQCVSYVVQGGELKSPSTTPYLRVTNVSVASSVATISVAWSGMPEGFWRLRVTTDHAGCCESQASGQSGTATIERFIDFWDCGATYRVYAADAGGVEIVGDEVSDQFTIPCT